MCVVCVWCVCVYVCGVCEWCVCVCVVCVCVCVCACVCVCVFAYNTLCKLFLIGLSVYHAQGVDARAVSVHCYC